MHENLRVSSEYPFCSGDSVAYESEEGKQYCMLSYEETLGAFLLIHFVDEKYSDIRLKENGMTDIDFLHEIGLNSLEKI